MKLTLMMLTCLSAIILLQWVQDGHAWPRLPRLPRICCGTRCTGLPVRCSYSCRSCRKRSFSADSTDTVLTRKSNTFSAFDMDNSGTIDAKEFSDLTGTELNVAERTLQLADQNDDGNIDQDEFEAAPWESEDLDGRK